MKNISPLAWFEIVVQDFESAVKFYETAFNMQLNIVNDDEMQYAIFPYTQPHVGGALVHSHHYADHRPGPGTTLIYLHTNSVKHQLNTIESLGGKVEMASTSIGENGFIGVFVDLDGNYVGLWSSLE